jgi:hypothetical protein
LPPALSVKNLPGERTQVFNICHIQIVDCSSAEHDEDSVPESLSSTENWLNWNGDLDNSNVSNNDCKADDEYNVNV